MMRSGSFRGRDTWGCWSGLASIRALADAVELPMTVDEDERRVISEGRHPLAEPCVQYSAK